MASATVVLEAAGVESPELAVESADELQSVRDAGSGVPVPRGAQAVR